MKLKTNIKSLLIATAVIAALMPVLVAGYDSPILLLSVLVCGGLYGLIFELPKILDKQIRQDTKDDRDR